MANLITVFGATGNQGGSVIKAILADPVVSKEYKIRGITRDVSKPAAQALVQQGVEVKSADMDSPASLLDAVRGSHTVFLVTTPGWGEGGAEIELTHGTNVANAAKEAGVKHIIYSSLLNVTETSGGRLTHVPHFDFKQKVEQYIRSTGLPATFVLPGYFMSNFAAFGMIRKGEDGVYTLAYPVADSAKFPLIDIPADLGKFVLAAIKKSAELIGTQILASDNYYTPAQILADFEAVTGQKTRYVQVDSDTYKSFMPPAAADELLENHLFIENPGYYNGRSLEDSQKLISSLGLKTTTWKEYVEKHKDSLV
ncbi:NmrA-like family domain-containing protein 1 [Penicillium rolfsii]|nr:NmrA-like family domain-containing protein 1 [Penicillium rolfsii]